GSRRAMNSNAQRWVEVAMAKESSNPEAPTLCASGTRTARTCTRLVAHKPNPNASAPSSTTHAPPRERMEEDCSTSAKLVFASSKDMHAPNPSAQASMEYVVMDPKWLDANSAAQNSPRPPGGISI